MNVRSRTQRLSREHFGKSVRNRRLTFYIRGLQKSIVVSVLVASKKYPECAKYTKNHTFLRKAVVMALFSGKLLTDQNFYAVNIDEGNIPAVKPFEQACSLIETFPKGSLKNGAGTALSCYSLVQGLF